MTTKKKRTVKPGRFVRVKPGRTIKRSVTFSADVDARAHDLVGERNFSSFVNEATRAALNLMATNQIIEEYEAQHGLITEGELAAARTVLQKARKSRK